MPHLDAIYTAALHLARNEHDASDLTQETVLRAYRFFEQFTPGTNCRAWLLTILHNVFRDGYRRQLRQPLTNSAEEMERAIDSASLKQESGRVNPESLVMDKVLDYEVQAALRGLPDEVRTVLLMVDVDELSYQEAANVLTVPIGTVRSRLSRARALMREALNELARKRR